MITVRECQPGDYQGVSHICSLTRPEPFSAEELMEEDRRAKLAGSLTRLVAIAGSGQVVGYGYAEHMPWFAEGDCNIYAASHPEHRGQGVGTALYQEAERIALAGGATSFTAWCSSRDPENFAWAERRGFANDLLRTESVLDLSGWDDSRFADHVGRVQAGGIRFAVYDGDEPEHVVQGIYEVERLTGPDVPDYVPDAPFPTFEVYHQMWREYKEPRLTVIALDGDRIVGTTFLFYSRMPGKGAYTGYTGVLREYRGRGIALAVKLLGVEAAVSRGVPRLRTNNDFENPAMLAVNEKLGYQLVPGPRRIKKVLG